MTLLLLLTLMVSAFCVSAKDIDVESMSHEELMRLLQMIMQKLESNETEDAAESLPDDVIGADRFSNVKLFTIYENKKLIIEAIPDYMFYHAPDDTSEPEKKEKKEKKDDDSHGWVTVTDDPLMTGCQHGEQWVCDIYGECHCMIWDGSGS